MSEHTTHTPGRIRFYENGEANSYAMLEVDADDRWLLTLLHNGHDVTERQKANMHRLVACWNACEGIDTELLESKMLGDQIAAKMGLIDQRDELLEAIKVLLLAKDEKDQHGDNPVYRTLKQRGWALAKAAAEKAAEQPT